MEIEIKSKQVKSGNKKHCEVAEFIKIIIYCTTSNCA
jgi:hypothetical protein